MSEHAMAAGKAFPWHELYVADAGAAKAFYTDLLGWSVQEFEMGEMGTYTMLVSNGTPIAGIMQTAGNPDLADMPPHWSVYMAVDDVDATVAKSTALGGTVVVPAMDVPQIGRMALLCDPQSAMFWVYKGIEG